MIKKNPFPSAPLPLRAKAFGLKFGTVRLIQTHIGWIYLAGKFAFKLKKHVRFDFLNFKTLKGRRWACEREIQLNRRLCPDLYVGLCPVLKNGSGLVRVASELVLNQPDQLFKAPQGERLIDWAVWMHRMPDHRMLNTLLDLQRVKPRDVELIAEQLSTFYSRQRRNPLDAAALKTALRSIRYNINENLREGRTIDHKLLAPGALKLIEVRARGFLKRNYPLISTRARKGFVLDGHGDLRSENICLPKNSPPLLFDCIEFNDRFRICDTALDAAYLAMDLDSHHRHDLSTAFINRHINKFDHELPPKLLNFYLGYRAFVKAKVAAWIASDKNVSAAQRVASEAQARMLFDLAVGYALLGQRVLIVFCGVSGSGKSSLASHLSARLNCPHLATDIIRDEVVPRGAPVEKRYAPAVSGRVYQLLFQRAAKLLSGKPADTSHAVTSPVAVMDGTFLSVANRARAAKLASDHGAVSILVFADSTPQAIAAHFKQRNRSRTRFGSEARLLISQRQQSVFEKPSSRESFDAFCRIDTSGDLAISQFSAWNGTLAALGRLLR